MRSRYAVSALLLGAALIATTPSDAAWRHPVVAHGVRGPHFRFAFHHDFHHFSPIEHRHWVGGRWRHFWWHGHYGWWWGAGGAWYLYDAPVYPYPTDVSPTYYDEDDQSGYTDDQGDDQGYGDGGGYDGGGSWYHCANPNGYYPYVQTCRGGWEQVPAQPSDMQGGPGGPGGGPGDYGPRGGPQGGPGPDDQGPPPPPPGR